MKAWVPTLGALAYLAAIVAGKPAPLERHEAKRNEVQIVRNSSSYPEIR